MKQKMSSLILLSVLCTHALAAETAKPALKVTSIVAKSFFPESELQSKYTSWGIDPDQKNASINLKESWFKFKKNREITVAVIDTGIDFSHPFLQQKRGNWQIR